MKKCIVFLQPNRITCYCKSAAGYLIDQEWTIAADELPSDFSDYLAGNRYAEFTLLLDLPEEECHLQDLKATGFRDRRHIIERLKSRRFENSLLTNSTIARFRQNVTLLLTVIDNNTLCESLIKTLSTAGICLKAIHSATTLTPILAKRVAARKGAQLFFCLQEEYLCSVRAALLSMIVRCYTRVLKRLLIMFKDCIRSGCRRSY